MGLGLVSGWVLCFISNLITEWVSVHVKCHPQMLGPTHRHNIIGLAYYMTMDLHYWRHYMYLSAQTLVIWV